ncbi:MAG: hypothetical protein JXM71_05270 [Spirochaetales bacterium]|nr:hypothetical protein [Spirochaetales bacterium]
MFLPVFISLAAATLFYAILPVVGAFIVREQWRQFRKRVVLSSSLPELCASALAVDERAMGLYRAYGEVDAISGVHELWIATAHGSLVVDLRDAWVYVLANRDGEDKIDRRRWSGVLSVRPGARAFVAGVVIVAGGRVTMGRSGKDAPLVLLHDGEDDRVSRRAVWSGRHENEYWNPVTQVSLALGVVTMSSVVSLFLPVSRPSLVNALMLTAAFSPLLPLLPPGVIGFFGYRRFWKRARFCRARRDMEALEADNTAATAEWRRRANLATLASVASFAGALAINAWLAVFVLRRLL